MKKGNAGRGSKGACGGTRKFNGSGMGRGNKKQSVSKSTKKK